MTISPTQNRNALRSAFDAAHVAANKVADIRLTLDIWSARQPLVIEGQSQRELRRLFNEVRSLLAAAEQGFEEALAAPPGGGPGGAPLGAASPAVQHVQHVDPAGRTRRTQSGKGRVG